MGLRRVYRAEAECRLRLDGSRLASRPWALQGGLPGGSGTFVMGEGVDAFERGAGRLLPGQTVEIITPGAGGYGSPALREGDLVARDIAEGRIDSDTAARIYGHEAA